METRQEILNHIIGFEAKEAQWGAKASQARKTYCKYSEHQIGDNVILSLNDGETRYGIINHLKYSTHWGFRYQIRPTNKNGGHTHRKDFYNYSEKGDNLDVKEIKANK